MCRGTELMVYNITTRDIPGGGGIEQKNMKAGHQRSCAVAQTQNEAMG